MQQNVDKQLDADLQLSAEILANGQLEIDEWSGQVCAKEYSWLLEVTCRARGRWHMPYIETLEDGNERFTQYLPAGASGKHLLNLSGITDPVSLRLLAKYCQLHSKAKLLGFRRPSLDRGPILIVAPHPDDAELAAYGLYSHYPHNTWIITLTPGETLTAINRQYLPQLDSDAYTGSWRKGMIRAWNSATTPMLAGLPTERLVMLGYFNDTLATLLAHPATPVASAAGEEITPGHFRTLNRQALATDAVTVNCGENLLSDLADLLRRIKPSTLIVTHPELDPHPDHIAAAKACARAIQLSCHQPDQVLLYANHLRNLRRFPYGPAHAAAAPVPPGDSPLRLAPYGFYSEPLGLATQKEKAVAMDTMHDLRARLRLEKRLKRWLRRKASGLEPSHWPDYGAHDYFQTHIKAHENFYSVSGARFMSLLCEG